MAFLIGQVVAFTERKGPAGRAKGSAQRLIDASGAGTLSGDYIGQVTDRYAAGSGHSREGLPAEIERCFAEMGFEFWMGLSHAAKAAPAPPGAVEM